MKADMLVWEEARSEDYTGFLHTWNLKDVQLESDPDKGIVVHFSLDSYPRKVIAYEPRVNTEGQIEFTVTLTHVIQHFVIHFNFKPVSNLVATIL